MKIIKNIKDKFYQKIIKIIIVFYGVFILISFIKEVSSFKLGLLSEYDVNPLHNFELFIIDWFVVVSIFILITLSIKREKFGKIFKLKKILLFHIPLIVVFNFCVVGSLFIYLTIIGRTSTFSNTLNEIILNTLLSSDVNTLLYMSMICFIYIYFYFNAYKEKENREAYINSQLIKAKHNVLKSKLEPHFIFNTLNNISSLMNFDIELAQKSISNLGVLLRGIISKSEKEWVTLQEEIDFLEKYLELIRIRFLEDIIINKEIDNNAKYVLVPNFIIQPIIENSIKHGFSKEILKIEIRLDVFVEKNYLNILIKNNGCYLASSFEDILALERGVSNTNERLKIIYGTDFKFEVNNLKDAQGVVSRIIIPISN